MSRNQFAATLMCVFLCAGAGGFLSSRIFADQSRPVSPSPQTQQPSTTSLNAPEWEYRLLVYNPHIPSINNAAIPSNRSGDRVFESEINKLAEEGFQVDSFQPVSPLYGKGENGFFSINSNFVIWVLLKRRVR
ncbi:MAG: hypothetical protein L0229_24665 [Blastocatellia bacterium]|nr:hypothetical protein [Blastocatellia bacterium]